MKFRVHEKLINAGFRIRKSATRVEISKNLSDRYVNPPGEYLTFLKSFESITNPSCTTWFVSNNDFNGKTDDGFRWNEFERMSLEWSVDDDEELRNIKEFWRDHIPIILSVQGGYQFWAICLAKEKYGEIVHGQEPVFEEVTKVCSNFDELIDLLERKQIKALTE